MLKEANEGPRFTSGMRVAGVPETRRGVDLRVPRRSVCHVSDTGLRSAGG